MKKCYVTTPIFYLNDRPHIGHAYTTLLADFLARYNRLLDNSTFFLTGTDEHGQKMQQAAENFGISPKELADKNVIHFSNLWNKLGISNDCFIRTTDKQHIKIVQAVLQYLFDKNEIYKAEYNGYYCIACEYFLTKKDLCSDKCPQCHREVEFVTESNYFFRLGKYQKWLVEYINKNQNFIQPEFRRNETLGMLREPIDDLCISRPKTRLKWGIELPFDSDFVTYVWFDALLNYVTAIKYKLDNKIFKQWWSPTCQIIGKDILKTHTIYWPIMLKAMNLPLPKMIFAHGWWLSKDTKMSKSVGNVVSPMDLCKKYDVDYFRYYLISEMVMGRDASFSEENFIDRYNTDLANNLGNTLNRVVKLVNAHCNGHIPSSKHITKDEEELQILFIETAQNVEKFIEKMRLDIGVAGVIDALRGLNRYFDKQKPWEIAKSNNIERLHTVLYTSLEALRIASGLLYPIMPKKMKELRSILGCRSEIKMCNLKKWGELKPDILLREPKQLFPRIKSHHKSNVKTETPNTEEFIEYADFKKIKLQVATIIKAEKIQGADKLLLLQVKTGNKQRQIVSGLAKHYSTKELIGKAVIIVTNLKPAKIYGILSDGMLLAAADEKNIRVLTVDGNDISAGTNVL